MGDPRVAATPVTECGEDLVDLSTFRELSVAEPEDDFSASYTWVRRGLAQRLLDAQAALSGDLRLHLVEGHRPAELQQFYFDRYRQRLTDSDPRLGAEESFLLASRYVSPPEVAPHVSGAAIDLTLIGPGGAPVDMGTPIDATPEASLGACYVDADNISSGARLHRQVLADALSMSGLVNYPTEWWHWSYGDRYWALITGQPAAIYGPTAPR